MIISLVKYNNPFPDYMFMGNCINFIHSYKVRVRRKQLDSMQKPPNFPVVSIPVDAFYLSSLEVTMALLMLPAFIIILGLVSLVVCILYLITLQSCFATLPEKHRELSPGLVWLLLVPLFNLVWVFIVVLKLSSSFKNAFAERGVTTEVGSCSQGIGLAYCILCCCSVIPLVNFVAAPAGFICWVIYWSQVASLKNKYIGLGEPAPRPTTGN